MKWRAANWSLLIVASVCVGCVAASQDLTPGERSAIVREVDSATHAFADSERARDVDRILGHLAPEFYMYNDGMRTGYDAVAEQIRQTMPALQAFETEWSNMEVTPLGRDHALVSFRFNDNVTDPTGTRFRFSGPTTLVWERRGDGWFIIYADADHYEPDVPAN